MKKQLLISLLVAAATGLAFGQGQFSTSTGGVQVEVPRATPAPAVTGPVADGVVQVAVRNGNPLQMVNPAAPDQYGHAHEHVTHDPADPGKPKGIKLFAWSF